MVGIGGGVLPKVRLGDVVISAPLGQFPGVVQWDFGKAGQGSKFERTGSLNNPPISLLTALAKLETTYEMEGSQIPDFLDELKKKYPKLVPKYLRSDSLEDVLFKAEYNHVNESPSPTYGSIQKDENIEEEETCQHCDRSQVVRGKPETCVSTMA